jgi:hypothetical protein
MSNEPFSLSLANVLQFGAPPLTNGVRASLDIEDLRFDCERRFGLSWWRPCLSPQLLFKRNVSMPPQGSQEIALEASNFC